jgi:uncharacterized membrane protein
LAVILRALLLLAATASALTLFVIELRVKSTASLLIANDLTARNRNLAVVQVLAVGALVFIAGAVYAWRQRIGSAPWLRWLSHLGAPFLLLPFLPALLVENYADLPTTVAAFAIFVLLLERLLRVSATAWEERAQVVHPRWLADAGVATVKAASRLRPPPWLARHLPLLLVLAGVAFYAFYIGKYTVYQHRKFGTMGYDLGQYDALVYSTLKGLPMRCSPLGMEEPWSSMKGHADLGIAWVLPFYALKPGAEALLVFQAVVLALGALPLFLFSRRWLPDWWALVVAYAYLCYPPLHGANFYDFHLQPIGGVLTLAAIYCLEARRYRLYWVFFFMALVCREDVSIGLTIFGLFCVLAGYRPRTGTATAVIAGTYFVVMKFAVMPQFGPWWFSEMYRDLYPADDRSFRGVVRTLITNPAYVFKTLLTPEKLRYSLQVMAPLLFLPVRRSFLVPAILTGSMSTLLTTGYAPTLDTGFQYIGHFIGYIFPATAVALSLLAREPDGVARRRAAGAALLVATVIASVIWGAFSPRDHLHGGFGTVVKSPPSAEHKTKAKVLAELAAQVPPGARLAVTEAELPHLSTRLHIFSLRDGLFEADYLLYDVNGFGAKTAEDALSRGEYARMEEKGGLKLLRRIRTP